MRAPSSATALIRVSSEVTHCDNGVALEHGEVFCVFGPNATDTDSSDYECLLCHKLLEHSCFLNKSMTVIYLTAETTLLL